MERLHGAPLQADARMAEQLAGRNLTHDDHYAVHRFAEMLRVRHQPEPQP